MKRLLGTLALMMVTLAVVAVPARRGVWRTVTLSDGTTTRVQLVGDEHMHYYADAEGRQYAFDQATKHYMPLSATVSNAMQRRAQQRRQVAGRRQVMRRNAAVRKAAYTGKKKGLVILMDYSDVKFASGHDRNVYNDMLNTKNYSENGFQGSVSDYFRDQSNGVFELDFDVVGPYTAKYKMSYYGQNDTNGEDMHPTDLIREAVLAADADVDYTQYDWDGNGYVDQVYVVYAGKGEADSGEENTIWPHEYGLSASDEGKETLDGKIIDTYACGPELDGMSSNNKLSGIGTFCHEFSHCLGFPDLYDTDYSGWYGMGDYDLMCGGCYNGDSNVPAGYTSWEKWVAGWLTPTELTLGDDLVTIDPLQPLSKNGGAYIIYNPGNKDEYYILENRQKNGWDASLPGKGLLIMHVDYDEELFANNIVNTELSASDARYYGLSKGNDHQRMTIFHADNDDDSKYYSSYYGGYTKYTTSTDLYPYGSNDSLTNNSKPACTLYNNNSDGTKLMNCAILDITQNADGTVTFGYRKSTTPSSDTGGGDNGGTVEPQGNVLLHETFDQCNGNGGNDGKFSGNFSMSVFMPDLDGWSSEKAYGASKCAKFGTSSVVGEVTSPTFTMPGDTLTLSFRAAGWNATKDGKTLRVTLNDAKGNAVSGIIVGDDSTLHKTADLTMEKGAWTTYTLKLVGKLTGASLTFQPSKRFFLDDVLVVKPENSNGGTDGIKGITTRRPTDGVTRVYSIDGRYLGTSTVGLQHGLYIVNGRKVVIR